MPAWIFLTQLLVLSFVTFRKERWDSPEELKSAWKWFSFIPFSHAFFTLFRADKYDHPDLVLVEIWANGFAWLFLGFSLLKLSSFMLSDQKDS